MRTIKTMKSCHKHIFVGNKVACSVISRVGQLMDVLRCGENIQKIHCKNGNQESCVELVIS